MLGFWQTIKIVLRLPYAKFYATAMILGPASAFAIPKLIANEKVSMFLMMLVVFLSSVCIEQFCAYVRAVRMEDIKRNTSSRNSNKKKSNKRR